MVDCEWCNNPIINKKKDARFCSKKCIEQRRYYTKRRTYKPIDKKCVECSKIFIASKRSPNQKTCSLKCRKLYMMHRLGYSIYRTKPCKVCGNDFTSNHNKKIYCSNECNRVAYEKRNNELILKRRKEYRKLNKDRLKLKYKVWIKDNPTKKKFYDKQYYAYKKGRKHTFSQLEWYLKLYKTHGFCPSCDKYVGINKLTLDHIVPLSKSPVEFEYGINEIQPLCKSCNSSKKDTMVVV